jgi:energy-coupling factor transporter ATP-binding protein EcfA2
VKSLGPGDVGARSLARGLLGTAKTQSAGANTDANDSTSNLVKILWGCDWASWRGDLSQSFTAAPSSSLIQASADGIPIGANILSSLSFSNMNSRISSISHAHAKTFQWILGDAEAPDAAPRGVGFPAWLEQSSQLIYWITGKPGSGKSTLMKYLLGHQRVASHLRVYAGDAPLLMAGFCAWNPGTEAQHSREGLLRTLLYHCLSGQPELIPLVSPRRWAFFHFLGPGIPSQAPRWTTVELQESFEKLVALNGKLFRLALFIDGLDEFAGDHGDLIRWIKDTVSQHHVKFCVSSRPWNVFSDAFQQEPSLTMQDLTSRDIQAFIHTNFSESQAFQDLRGLFPEQADAILGEIHTKSAGVFLWVTLVVKTLLEMLVDNPSLPELQNTLTSLPSDINSLYDRIFSSIPVEKQSNMSKVFQLAVGLHHRAPSLPDQSTVLWLAYIGHETRETIKFVSLEDARRISKLFKRVVDGHTRGIFEVTAHDVSFLHRTAADWLMAGEKWKQVCDMAPPDFCCYLEILEALAVRRRAAVETMRMHPDNGVLDVFAWQALASLCFEAYPTQKRRVVLALDRINKFNAVGTREWQNGTDPEPLLNEPADKFDSDLESYVKFSRNSWGKELWSEGQTNFRNLEHSFVNEAAAHGLLPYVQAKVCADPDLLLPKPERLSLLAYAILWPNIPESRGIYLMGIGKLLYRLEVIEWALEESKDLPRSTYVIQGGKSLYDLFVAVWSSSPPALLMTNHDRQMYFRVVARLLRENGYGPSTSSPGSQVDGKRARTKGFFRRQEEIKVICCRYLRIFVQDYPL